MLGVTYRRAWSPGAWRTSREWLLLVLLMSTTHHTISLGTPTPTTSSQTSGDQQQPTTSDQLTPNTPNAKLAFFNSSTDSLAFIRGTLNLTGQTVFSFRTCSHGVLVSQKGSSGDALNLTVNQNGGLTMLWRTSKGITDSVSLGGSNSDSSSNNKNGGGNTNTNNNGDRGFSDNQWYTVDLKYLLGEIYLRVESGGRRPVESVLVSNSTYRVYLWDLNLSGSRTGITVGYGFTGCIDQGVGIQFDTPDTTGRNVRWGECPLEGPTVRGCDLQGYNPCYSFPCLNGGSCVANGSDFTCRCPVPFSGQKCEQDLGDQACSLEPCKNGGTCSIMSGQTRRFFCNCPKGFAGIQCENNIDECGSLPCRNGGRCEDQINGFICDCAGTGYSGVVCEDNLDECENGSPCQNGGLCINTPGSYKCSCPNGYDGKNCEIDLDECVSQPCQNNGMCTDYLGQYKCDCPPGFTGANCEINIDDCVNHACVHPRHCVDLVNDHRCECKPGYQEGANQQCEDLNECVSNPCINGGVCENEENSFVCRCQPGYAGVTCEQDINECASRPCQNGASCYDEVNRFRCECPLGFTGLLCSVDIDECASNPCMNGAFCNNMIGMYTCACLPGFTGARCEVNIDECAAQPCLNNAQCVDEINAFACLCPLGFDGLRCENNIDDCLSGPCQNGATCVDGVASYKCNCTSAWMGPTCQQPYDACEFGPCFNGATCSAVLGTPQYSCRCPAGFTGRDCEINIDDCVAHNCMPYQVCIDEVEQFRCECPTGYRGAQCQEEIDECSSNPCLNGATCQDQVGNYTCVCPGQWIDLRNFSGNPNHIHWSGYTGRHCEHLTNECTYDPPVCLNNGICKKEVNQTGFTCYCGNNAGNFYLGKHCEKTRQHCELEEDPPPCHNGGTCFNLEADYRCECAPGFTDTTIRNRCRVNIDECASSPCQNNGTCVDGINSYECVCPPGLSGDHCEVNIDECLSTPCLNGGRCLDAINRNEYVCDCGDTGFEGPNCELNIDDCNPTPCMNGATCVDGIKNYTCHCYFGYTGVDCHIDIDECMSQPCQNGATCLQRSEPSRPNFSYANASGYECQCAPGYNGTHCEQDIDECEVNPCRNGACQDRINSYFCLCDPGYTGKNCDIDIDECALYKPCKNGAQCIDQIASYQCICAAEKNGVSYGGVNCTVLHTGCDGHVCQNDARCVPYLVSEAENIHNYTCHCQPGFTGFYCEIGTTATFSGNSWLQYNISTMLSGFTMDLNFRTTLPNGTLFYMSDPTGMNRMFLTLAAPRLLTLTIKIGDGNTKTLSADSMRDLNDAEWHTLRLRTPSALSLSLAPSDCVSSQCEFILGLDSPTLNLEFSKILFGGLQSASQEASLSALASPLTGCLQDIKINDNFVLPSEYLQNPQMSSGVSLGCPRTDPCLPQPCENGGTCVDLWDRFICNCERPYIGDTCNVSVIPVTFGYRNMPSLVEFPIPLRQQGELASVNHLSLFFRTRQESGLLAFLGPVHTGNRPKTFLRVDLQDGFIVVSYAFSPIVTTNEKLAVDVKKYNDGEQHFVYIDRTNEKLKVRVDADEKERTVSVDLTLTAEVLYLGALPEVGSTRRRKRQAPMVNPKPFKGTLQDVRLNGLLAEMYRTNASESLPRLVASTTNGIMEEEVDDDLCAEAILCEQNATCESVFFNDYKCHCPEGFKGKNCSELNFCIYNQCPGFSTCNDLVDGHECTIPATFNGNSTMMQYSTTFLAGSSTQNTFKVGVRTRETEGLLLHLHGARAISTYYVTLQLFDSRLSLRYDLGEYGTRTMMQPRLNDGQWHNISLIIQRDQVIMSVDAESDTHLTAQSMTLGRLLDGSSSIFLGGVPESYYNSNTAQFPNKPSFFKGCMDEPRIDKVLLPFFTLDEGYNSSAKEQFSVVSKMAAATGCNGDPVCNGNNCSNGATCMDIWNAYECNCIVGFNGTYCENNIDDCVNHGCMNGATCSDQIANYTCACAPGYTDYRCQTEIDECASDPCQNNATCYDQVNGYFCNCSANYTGANCEVSVTEKCDNVTNYPCVHGICNTVNTAYEGVVTFECQCLPGYTGNLCESEIDYCAVDPCINGSCRSNINITDYECLCEPGYAGKNCSEEIDECLSQPCQHGATCSDYINGYNCTCPPEWTGTHCEADVNECNFTTSPCERGICDNKDGGYHCDCTGTGYEGDRCQHEIDECKTIQPCQNGADCINLNGTYQCNCTVGYQDKNCSTPNCTDVCMHNGTCSITADNKWKCSCPEHHEGSQCEYRGPCADMPCGNGGTCGQRMDPPGNWSYRCNCMPGWMGKNCTDNIDECTTLKPCQNGATCIDRNGTYDCVCAAGFTGYDCETDIDECMSQPCQHGATCNDEVNGYNCTCAPGFQGVNCEEDIKECDEVPGPCVNGTCEELVPGFKCNCYTGYLGHLCDKQDPCYSDDPPCQNGGNCSSIYNDTMPEPTFQCFCTDGFTGPYCNEKVGGITDGDNGTIPLIIGLSVFAVLLIIFIAVIAFMLVAKNKRATRGTYSPSRQEMSGSRVEMNHTLKPPPEERLI